MARGFESKSVQEQWQDAEAWAEQKKNQQKRSHDEIERAKQRENLNLSRSRVARELAETKSEARRKQLQAALAHIDGELAKH